MKKSYLIIAAAAAIFAACQDTDSIREIKDQGTNNAAITFSTGSEKLTRAENSDALYTRTFFEHQSNFEVWGYKILDPTVAVFGATNAAGTVVNVTNKSGVYTYKYDSETVPLRFWDKTSPNYQFYAAAPANPADGAWTFTYTGATADPTAYGTGTFATTSALNGVNLQSVTNGKASEKLKNTFKEATLADGTTKDIDKMIAAPCQVEQVSYNKPTPDAVHLNFIHILSKLNITIKTDLSNLYTVKLLGFEVKNMPGKGNFNEATETADGTKKNSRWNQTGYTYTDKIDYLTGIDNGENAVIVTDKKQYIVESLVIPQDISYERVALDGKAHDEIDEDEAKPYASYAAYEAAKHNDRVTRLTEAQFNALINNGAFVSWANYDHTSVPGETNTFINEATFNGRVAEATKEGTTPYSNYTEYAEAKGDNAILTEAQFNALINGDAFVEWDAYTPIEGENADNRIDEDEFKARVAEAAETPETHIDAYLAVENTDIHSSEPYFMIKYSINGDVFTGYYNLVAAFNGLTNNEILEGEGALSAAQKKLAFNEGWQNTLNIKIKPTAIEFTADVADWSDAEQATYEIEKGNY